VPTPFYHLKIAEDLLRHQALWSPGLDWLQDYPGAFYLGNTAPDVQVVSGENREATHFFILPFQEADPLPWEVIFEMHPQLKSIPGRAAQQSAFLAGYLCHLQADWMWVKEIFAPIFGPGLSWGTFYERLYIHNVLRSYLDRRVFQLLPHGLAACLDSFQPDCLLPFLEDSHLIEWRDYLSDQLQPGALPQTVEVFASRQGISIEQFYALLDSEKRMDEEVFCHIPIQDLEDFRHRLISENLILMHRFERTFAR
jgi:hypothetical protein